MGGRNPVYFYVWGSGADGKKFKNCLINPTKFLDIMKLENAKLLKYIQGGERVSIENVKKFYEAVSQDEAMKQKFVELSQKYQGQPMDEAKVRTLMEKEALPLAAQMGYSFTMDDLKAFGEEIQHGKMNCELNDEEMQAVAGGVFVCVVGGGGEGVVCVVIGLNAAQPYPARFCCIIGLGT